ncbi:MAG: terminase large subunit [Pseudoflavonifractor sp.]|nr:terminase large subunit [Alloprevotella sp.]MCM1117632.1 terminase large subunit [Pseudoflavonifractor sp.]
MTEEERAGLAEAKARVSEALTAIPGETISLMSETDPRIADYVTGVADHPEAHNLWEQLAVERFVKMIGRYGLDRRSILRFFAFYESLYFPGVKGSRQYRLTPVQAFQFASIYGFHDADGRRVVKEAVLYVPRKFSKTTSSASVAIYDLLYGDANAESYTGANSQDQAKKCFDVIRGCMRRLDPQGRRYTVNEQVIKSARKDRTAFAQCLTANARTKDGLNASTVIMDEFSQARDAGLLTVLTTSMGIRRNPLTVIITTASDVFDGPFRGMLDGYKRMLLGEAEDDPSVFAHLFEPDVDDDEGSEDTWRKVHPHMGVTVTMDFYRREWASAKRNGAEAMLAFRTKLLNVYSENARKSWISSAEARAAAVRMRIRDIQGRPDAMVAIDLSERDDFSAVTVSIYNRAEHSQKFHTAYFFPEAALSGHPNEALYRKWAADGHLTLLPGEVIDYRRIVDYVTEVSKYVRILGIGFDPWKSQEVVNMLGNAGGPSVLKPVRQTYGYFTAPVESFQHGLILGKVKINDNPINFYCFGNAVLDEDRLENVKPIKRYRMGKIDGVITMLMAQRLWLDS